MSIENTIGQMARASKRAAAGIAILARVAGLPVLGSVSMIMSRTDIAIRRRKTVAWVGANLALFVLCIVVIVLSNPITELLHCSLGIRA